MSPCEWLENELCTFGMYCEFQQIDGKCTATEADLVDEEEYGSLEQEGSE